jgi:hypothetical protein
MGPGFHTLATTWDGQPLPAAEHVHVELRRFREGTRRGLEVHVDAPYHGDPPPPSPPGSTPGLWEHEVVELFVQGPGSSYLEIEVGPHGHHLVLRLADVRRPLAMGLPLDLDVVRTPERWSATFRVPPLWIGGGGEVSNGAARGLDGELRGNLFACWGANDRRHYAARFPVPGPQPDFHQPARFGRLLPPLGEHLAPTAP